MVQPDDWPTASAEHTERALLEVRRMLSDERRTTADLAAFYSPVGNYAGPVFDARDDTDPGQVTATDLLAITAMQVQAGPGAIGRFLRHPESRADVQEALRRTRDVPLWEATDADLRAAGDLYTCVKRMLSDGNMWVAASKLCARKRPQLIPVRDSVIVSALGLPKNTDFRQDWLVIRAVMQDETVRRRLRECAEAADPSGATLLRSVPELRLLDVVVWMRYSVGGRRSDVVDVADGGVHSRP